MSKEKSYISKKLLEYEKEIKEELRKKKPNKMKLRYLIDLHKWGNEIIKKEI